MGESQSAGLLLMITTISKLPLVSCNVNEQDYNKYCFLHIWTLWDPQKYKLSYKAVVLHDFQGKEENHHSEHVTSTMMRKKNLSQTSLYYYHDRWQVGACIWKISLSANDLHVSENTKLEICWMWYGMPGRIVVHIK